MNVGDLVRRKKVPLALRQDPRVGIVRDTFLGLDGSLCCAVLWHDETDGQYFSTALEVLCK